MYNIVIGNPPYVDVKGLPAEDVKYYFKSYRTAENRINLYAIFIEKGISYLKGNGMLSFINPNSILVNESYKKIRKLLVGGVEKIIKLPDSVFETATVETILLFTRVISINESVLGLYFANSAEIDFSNLKFKSFKRSNWELDIDSRFNIFGNDDINQLLEKIQNQSNPLEDFVLTSLGITPYDKYKGHTNSQISNRVFHSSVKLSDDYVPLISGKNIHTYHLTNEVEEYLKYGPWLGAPREKRFFENPKIIVRQILSGNNLQIIAAFSDTPKYFTQIGFSLISNTDNPVQLRFILALLNSCLISFYHKEKFLDKEKVVFQKILIANCKKLPIKFPKQPEHFVNIVNQILSAKQSNPHADTTALENRIDELVYKLYNLTYAEVKIIDPDFWLSEEEYEQVRVE